MYFKNSVNPTPSKQTAHETTKREGSVPALRDYL